MSSPHLATDRPATSSDRAAPRRSAILPTSSSSPSSSILQVVRVSQSRRASRREGRERTRAKDAADLFARSSPLFCSVCCLHCPHHRQPLTASPARNIAKGEGRTVTPSASGRCYRHHLAADRPAAGHRLDGLPSCPPRPLPRPLFQVVRVGQRASQGGRSSPAHPADPLHPAGVPRHIGGHLLRVGGQRGAISGRRGSSSRKFVSGFFLRLYRSKYQLFIFSEGLSRAKPVPRGNDNDT